MLEERGRGAVLVGVARVDAALEHLLQALMDPASSRGDGLFMPDRPLGSLGAKVALARRLGLIDAPVERALSALRKLRNAFAHSAESASLADPAHSARLAEIYAEARTNPLWAPLETVLAAQPPLGPWPPGARPAGLHPAGHDPGGLPGGHGPAAQALSAASGDGLLGGYPPGNGWLMPLADWG
jgi:hypothetical protein